MASWVLFGSVAVAGLVRKLRGSKKDLPHDGSNDAYLTEVGTFVDGLLHEWKGQAGLVPRQFRAKASVDTAGLRRVRDAMAEALHYGLSHEDGDLHMLATYVDLLPTGREKGPFLAIDIGGTKFRVLRAEFSGYAPARILSPWPCLSLDDPLRRDPARPVSDLQSEEVEIPRDLLAGHSDRLFDFMASSMVGFLGRIGERGRRAADGGDPVLGFAFSFPMHQTGIAAGTLMYWSKGFACDGAVGKDPVELLAAAFRRQGFPVRITALINDGLGPLIAARCGPRGADG